jgi:hypothetical protein
MNLKLAEYKDGKFEKFLELDSLDAKSGETFTYASDYIELLEYVDYDDGSGMRVDHCHAEIYEKDEKDPLNRFDGLFDGRTYGEGKFVLIETPNRRFDEAFSINNFDVIKNDGKYYVYRDGVPTRYDDSLYGWHWKAGYCGFIKEFENVGNLIENPELWERVK